MEVHDNTLPNMEKNSTGSIFFFSKVIDNAYVNLKEYFNSTDLLQCRDLSETLLTGSLQPGIFQQYPELTEFLEQELEFFHDPFTGSTAEEYWQIFIDMVPDVHRMVLQMERLLLVSRASSCEAEWLF